MSNEQVKWIVGAILAVGIAIVIVLASQTVPAEPMISAETACMMAAATGSPCRRIAMPTAGFA